MVNKADVLTMHSIEWCISPSMNRLFVLDIMVDRAGKVLSQWLDVTDWSNERLYTWLGY